MFECPDKAGVSRWPLVRIQLGGETRVILLNAKFLPLTVHWIGRSVPCCVDECALCSLLPARGLFYYAVACQGRASILELGSVSSANLEQHVRLLHGGMRAGLEIRVSRRSLKAPVHCEVMAEHSSVSEFSFLSFVSRVAALYHLPAAQPGQDFEDYGARLAAVCRVRNVRSACELTDKNRRALPA